MKNNNNEIEIRSNHRMLAASSLVILGIIFWMIFSDFSALIALEKKTNYLFQEVFGTPLMTYSSGFINSIMTFLAIYVSPKYLSITAVVIAALLFVKNYRFLAIWFLGVISSGGLTGVILKNIFRRERPMNHLPWDDGFSFPSGHAIAATLFFMAILLVLIPKIKNNVIRMSLSSFLYVIWFVTLLSRLYFHAHHLGDLVAGVSFGIFWVTISMFVYNMMMNGLNNYLLQRNTRK